MSGFTTHDVLRYVDLEWTSPTQGKVSVPCDREGGSISISQGGIDTSDPSMDLQGIMGLSTGKTMPAEIVIKVLDSPQSYKIFTDYMKDQVGTVYLPAVFRDKEEDGVVFEINMRNVRVKSPGSVKFTCDLTSKVEMTLLCSPKDMKILTNFSI